MAQTEIRIYRSRDIMGLPIRNFSGFCANVIRLEDPAMYGISQEVIDSIVAHRGRLHCVDRIEPERTALVVIDMQNYFMKPGFQAEVPAARAIVPAINRAARALREIGGTVIWIQTAADGADRDWPFKHEYLLGPTATKRRMTELAEGSEGFALWPELDVDRTDLKLIKRRYSAFIRGSSNLERDLRAREIDTVLISGTATNVCCESTARDAMMLNFKTIMLADALAAQTTEAHLGSLTNCLNYFSDVMSVDEACAFMGKLSAPEPDWSGAHASQTSS